MYTVGITGGIGSGKTTICKIFFHLGIPVFSADLEAKKLLETETVKKFYFTEFGEQVFTNHQLDKAKIAALIFNDKHALAKVNAFIHPIVNELFTKWAASQKNSKYIINEAALLFENQSYKRFNETILVYAPLELRIERVVKRDQISKEQVLERIKNQLPEEEKQKLASYIIENDDRHFIIQQVLNIHNQIISKI